MMRLDFDTSQCNLVFINPSKSIYTTVKNFHPINAFGESAPKGNWRSFTRFGSILTDDRMPELVPFETNALYEAMRSVYLLGEDWENTQFYRRAIDLIEGGTPMWGCRSAQDFNHRVNHHIRALLRSIAKHGYLLQKDLVAKPDGRNEKDPSSVFQIGRYYDTTDDRNEVKVGIGPKGEIVFLEGQHRLSAAKLMQVQSIPALVAFRHERWQAVRSSIQAMSRSGEENYKIDHPDLVSFGLSETQKRNAIHELLAAGADDVPVCALRAENKTEYRKQGTSEMKNYLTHDRYMEITSKLGGGHWSNAKRRWVYHAAAVTFARLSDVSSASKVLEMGTMGINIVPGSDTIDYAEGWNFDGKAPTHAHDGRKIPWPIKNDEYELFIALRVYHHLNPRQKEAFLEARRIAKNIIIVAPESYDKVKGSKGIPLADLVSWNDGVEPTAMMEFGEEFGNLYYWNARSLGKVK